MTYPPGIILRPVTIGGATVLESGEQLSLVAEIRSSRSLMWGATGWQFHAVTRTIKGNDGEELTFSLPVTDLDGWRLLDNPGSAIDVSAPGSYTHSYTVKLTTLQGGRAVAVRTVGPFVLPTEDLSPVDLDLMLPVGTQAGGVVLVPDTWDARVTAAEAAAADMADLAGIINDALTAEDAAVAFLVGDDDSATRGRLDGQYGRGGSADIVCTIPTSDDNPDVVHPSVLHVPGAGWNGYPYWMAVTPLPDATRENPEVFCSLDGVHWQTPPGAVNPVFPLAWAVAQGYGFQSDTDLELVGNELWMLWRAVKSNTSEAVFLSKSADGVTWSDPTGAPLWEVAGAEPMQRTMSPSLVQLTGGDLAIFTINREVRPAASGIQVRTSTDGGVTWSAPADCAAPDLYNTYEVNAGIWHVDVQPRGEKLHMLAANPAQKLFYLESIDNGVTWTGSRAPAIGRDFSSATEQYYRSSFQPSHSGSGWDLWLSDWTNKRIRHHRNVDLSEGSQDLRLPQRGIWLSAQDFRAGTGAPAAVMSAGRHPAFAMPPGVFSRLGATFLRPPGWKMMRATIYWANDGDGVGDVGWECNFSSFEVGTLLNAPGTYDRKAAAIYAPAPGKNLLTRTVLSHTTMDSADGDFTTVMPGRLGDKADDTLANGVVFLGVFIEPA